MGAKKTQPNTSPIPEFIYDAKRGKELCVRIFADTTPEQFSTKTLEGKILWSKIASLQKKLPGFKLSKKEIHEAIYTLHYQHKWTYKQCRDFAKQEWGFKTKSLEDIGQIIYRVAKKINPELYIDKKRKK